MKRTAILAFSVLPISGWAQINAVSDLEIINPPISAQSVFNGQMLRAETEFLTPEGIVDEIPMLETHMQKTYVPLYAQHEEIEPAAGPEPETVFSEDGATYPDAEPVMLEEPAQPQF